MKRRGVRTNVMGSAWEERFLAAVHKAREGKLIPPEAAERLRLLAGAYVCPKCNKEHRTESKLGREHLRFTRIDPRQAGPGTTGDARASTRKKRPR